MEDERGFLSSEDIRELQLKQVEVSLRDKGGFVQGGSSLTFFEDSDQMFGSQEDDV